MSLPKIEVAESGSIFQKSPRSLLVFKTEWDPVPSQYLSWKVDFSGWVSNSYCCPTVSCAQPSLFSSFRLHDVPFAYSLSLLFLPSQFGCLASFSFSPISRKKKMLRFLTSHIPEKWGNTGCYITGRGQGCDLKLREQDKKIIKVGEGKKVK